MTIRQLGFWLVAATGLLQITQASAQPDLPRILPADAVFREDIPTPASVLGFDIGTWHVSHDQSVTYLRKLAEVSARVSLETVGYTHERRPLLQLVISSPSNVVNARPLREAHVTRALQGRPAAEDAPAIVMLGYSVHGNEASGANAALLVAYHLAATLDESLEALLNQVIIVMAPSLNPDGMQRFSGWVNSHKGIVPVADVNSREHQEVWPGGRTNHYWFDLNRDYVPVQQPETRSHVQQFHRWMPNVVADFHEMGGDRTYFFQPGAPLRTHPLTPPENQALTAKLAKFHARALDTLREPYYSEEGFDDFYYGKGSTYPDINGAVGVLFEMASARGHLRESEHGVLTFRRAVRNQYQTSFSTLRGAAALRKELLAYQSDFFAAAGRSAVDARISGYVVETRGDRERTRRFGAMLRTHGLDVYELARDLRRGGRLYQAKRAVVIPASQPGFRLLQALFETRTQFREPVFYDVSTWTLPLAFGFEYSDLDLDPTPVIGDIINRSADIIAGQAPDRPAVAYVLAWRDSGAARALSQLLQAGVRARVASKPFATETRRGKQEFGYGAIVVPGRQDIDEQALLGLLQKLARETGVDVHALDTGLTASGIDIGSPSLLEIAAPQPVLVVGAGVSAYEAGEIWHLLDATLGIPTRLVESERLKKLKLDDYTHLVFPDGKYENLGEKDIQMIDAWVRAGGVVIAQRRAVQWLAKSGLSNIRLVGQADDESDGDAESGGADAPERVRYADREGYRATKRIAGAILSTELDVTHPLGYGSLVSLPVFRRGELVAELLEDPLANVAVYGDSPLLSGYVAPDLQDRLAGSPALMVEKAGKGTIVSFLDIPNFRGFWFGTQRLLTNAMFFARVVEKSVAPTDDDSDDTH